MQSTKFFNLCANGKTVRKQRQRDNCKLIIFKVQALFDAVDTHCVVFTVSSRYVHLRIVFLIVPCKHPFFHTFFFSQSVPNVFMPFFFIRHSRLCLDIVDHILTHCHTDYHIQLCTLIVSAVYNFRKKNKINTQLNRKRTNERVSASASARALQKIQASQINNYQINCCISDALACDPLLIFLCNKFHLIYKVSFFSSC